MSSIKLKPLSSVVPGHCVAEVVYQYTQGRTERPIEAMRYILSKNGLANLIEVHSVLRSDLDIPWTPYPSEAYYNCYTFSSTNEIPRKLLKNFNAAIKQIRQNIPGYHTFEYTKLDHGRSFSIEPVCDDYRKRHYL